MLNAVFRYNNLYLYSLPGRFVWVSGYLLLATGLYNRARILGDWVLTAIFGPDITNLRIRK
jgi:hypothetical protein